MDDKNQKSIDDINTRIDKLSELGISVKVPLDLDYMSILLKGKSPKYYIRFSAWARNTLSSDSHMENLIEALLSHFAVEALTKRGEFSDEYIAGRASGILFLYEEMQRLSNVSTFISDNKKQS